MKKIKIFFVLFLCMTNIYAQDVITIKGHIAGNQSNDYLPYCAVQLKHSSIAIVSNETGDFELHISKLERNDTLLISYIGYDLFVQSIEQVISEKTTLFKLKEKPFTLDEVVIGPPISVKEIIKNVYENLKTNYIQSAFYLDGFFRTYEKRNNNYNTLIEAAVTIKDDGFNVRKKHWSPGDTYLKEVRSTYYTGCMDTVDASNALNSILMGYEKSIFDTLNNNQAILSVEKTEYEGNDKIISLRYNKRDEACARNIIGVFKINATDWSIVEFEIVIKYTEKKDKQITQLVTDSLKARDYLRQLKCNYNNFNGKYYLSSIYFKAVRDIISPYQTVLTEFNAEYVTNKIYFNAPLGISKSDMMNRKKNLYKQVWQKPYHPEFWKNYNIIVDNAELEKMRKDLNTKVNIDEQFNNTNKYQGGSKKK